MIDMFKFGHMSLRAGWRHEKEMLKLSIPHLDKVVEATSKLKDTVHAFCDGDVDRTKGCFEAVFKAEREADEVARKMMIELSKGPFHPIDKEELLRFILTADDIADNAKAAARKICLSSPDILSEDLKDDLKTLAEKAHRIAERTKEALEALLKDPKSALGASARVEELEEEIDDFRVNLLVKLLKLGDKLRKLSPWLMLKEAVENMEMVADKSEDTVDVIRNLSVSMA